MEPGMSDVNGVNIQAAARLLGMGVHTLRAWERRYGAVIPSRTENGRRLYSENDLSRLRKLGQLVARGHSIGSVAKLPESELAVLLKQVASSRISVSFFEHERSSIRMADILSALRSFEWDRLHPLLIEARQSTSARQFVLEVASPVLAEVGVQVQRGLMSIVQEHAFSAVLRSHLGEILQQSVSARAPGFREKIVFGTPEGDLHEFGILISAVLSAAHGFSVHYLGPNIPVVDLVLAVKKLEATHLIMGTTHSPLQNARKKLEDFLTRLSQNIERDTSLWVGGRGLSRQKYNEFHPLFRHFRTLNELDQALEQIHG